MDNTGFGVYPFGMLMPGRKFAAGSQSYRYSINGQERSDELNNDLTTAEFWQYDGRLGRRWNVDPIVKEEQSPYCTFDNNPINLEDRYGLSTDDPPKETSSKGHSKVLSEVTVTAKRPSEGTVRKRLFHGFAGPNFREEYYHRGLANYKGQSGWYTATQYINVLKESGIPGRVSSGGYRVGLNNSYTLGRPRTDEEIDEIIDDVDSYVEALGGYAEPAFYGAVNIGANQVINNRNFQVTGTIYFSSFNVEDMIGVGLLFKAALSSFARKTIKTIAAEAPFLVQEIQGFYIRSSSMLSKRVYTRNIQTLVSLENETSIVKLLNVIESEARSMGAKKIVINGLEIVNTKLFSSKIAKRLGYAFKKTGANSIRLTKKLK